MAMEDSGISHFGSTRDSYCSMMPSSVNLAIATSITLSFLASSPVVSQSMQIKISLSKKLTLDPWFPKAKHRISWQEALFFQFLALLNNVNSGDSQRQKT